MRTTWQLVERWTLREPLGFRIQRALCSGRLKPVRTTSRIFLRKGGMNFKLPTLNRAAITCSLRTPQGSTPTKCKRSELRYLATTWQSEAAHRFALQYGSARVSVEWTAWHCATPSLQRAY